MATRQQRATLDFLNTSRIVNLPQSAANGQPVVHEQLQGAIQNLAWKDNVRAGAETNVNLAAPGAAVGGVTMSVGNAFLSRGQTDPTENGIYIWNGAAVAATRRNDADVFDELVNAIVSVDEGDDEGTSWRQTQVGGTIGSDPILWAPFAAASAPASTTVAGVIEIATQGEVDAGTDPDRAVTPATLANWSGRIRRYSTTFGDGTNTSYTISHNIGSRDVMVSVRLANSPYDQVDCEVKMTDNNTVTLGFDVAPTSNELRVTVIG